MTFRFLQTSKPSLYRKEHLRRYPTAERDIDNMVREHRSVKKDKDGLPVVEINSIQELASFIKNECSESEVVVGYDMFYGYDGWYIEDYDSFRE